MTDFYIYFLIPLGSPGSLGLSQTTTTGNILKNTSNFNNWKPENRNRKLLYIFRSGRAVT